jgi:hypothetical protein
MYGSREVVVSSNEPSELRSCLSGSDAITLLEFVHKCLSCDSNKDFIALYPMIRNYWLLIIPFLLENNNVFILNIRVAIAAYAALLATDRIEYRFKGLKDLFPLFGWH